MRVLGASLALLVTVSMVFLTDVNHKQPIPKNNVAENTTKEESAIEERENTPQIFIQKVTITAYTPSPDETDLTPNITASNKLIQKNFIAVSPDIYKITGFGKSAILKIHENQNPRECQFQKINIPTEMKVQIEDLTNKRFSNRVDIVLFSKREAFIFGKCVGTLKVFL